MPPFALRQAKRAVNQTLDVQGFYAAIQSVFDVHQTGHGNALSVGGWPVLVTLEEMKANIKQLQPDPAELGPHARGELEDGEAWCRSAGPQPGSGAAGELL